MKKPPRTAPTARQTVGVLSISPIQEDHLELERIFGRPEWSLYTESDWTMHAAGSLGSALPVLRNGGVAIVLSERDLFPGTWRELLAELWKIPDPPLLIVTSLLADERLWAEALNLGAYDVLAKLFDAGEVIRTLSLAWLHMWNDLQTETRSTMAMAG